MKFEAIEKLKFADLFDGLYIGTMLTGVEIIICLIAWLFQYFILGTQTMEHAYIAMIFMSNIFFITVFKHKKILRFSVWEEIKRDTAKAIKRKKKAKMTLTQEQIEREHRIEKLKIKIAEFKNIQSIHEAQLKKLTGAKP